nr:MAG TPA: hypothetical protein [Caudoviricetes sp.]
MFHVKHAPVFHVKHYCPLPNMRWGAVMFYERQGSGNLVIVSGLTLTGGVTTRSHGRVSVIRSQRQSQSTNNLSNSVSVLGSLVSGNNIESGENTENGGEQGVKGLADLRSKHVYESPHGIRELRLGRY